MAFNFQGGQVPMGMGGQGQMMGSSMVGGPMMSGMMMFPSMGGPIGPSGAPAAPALNDQPLEFSAPKGPHISMQSPQVSSTEPDRENRKKEVRAKSNERTRSTSEDQTSPEWNSFPKSSNGETTGTQPVASIAGMPIAEGESSAMAPWPGMMPGPYPLMSIPPIMADPSLMMPQYGMMSGASSGAVGEQREIIQLKSVSLVPPPSGVPPPPTRDRPTGCKTIFIGGLAEKTTDELLREIFEPCGEICSIRLSNRRFCHIRFMHETSVDNALFFSGYRMRIDNKTDAAHTGRLHVDFAQARDDQYEWECKQRALQRQQRHREQVEKERFRVPSPPPVPHYSDNEATSIAEKLKSEGFGQAVQIVITWLERGDCNKRNASAFYSMIQSTNSHIRRLLQEKAAYEDELLKAKELMKARIQTILLQYAQIERVFTAASHKKVWDHFTKAQRKNIEMWSKQAAEIKTVELEEHLNTGGNDEMDVSSDEDMGTTITLKKKPKMEPTLTLKEEYEGLKCQMEAYKNEVELVREELRVEIEAKDSRLKVAQQTLQNMQQKLTEAQQAKTIEETRVRELKAELAKREASDTTKDIQTTVPTSAPASSTTLPDQHATLISLISLFLHVHPMGASVDYLWSYLEKLSPPGLRNSDIETVLYAYPKLFQQEVSGVGANVERKWVLKLFLPSNDSNATIQI